MTERGSTLNWQALKGELTGIERGADKGNFGVSRKCMKKAWQQHGQGEEKELFSLILVMVPCNAIYPGLKLEFPMWFIVSPIGWQKLLWQPLFTYRLLCLRALDVLTWECQRYPTPLSSLVGPLPFAAWLLIRHVPYSQPAPISGGHSPIFHLGMRQMEDGHPHIAMLLSFLPPTSSLY